MLIETLKVFCDAVDLKSFSRAAEANFVTQSAVSQQIRNLERHWKKTLIERGNREMQLTDVGQIVYRESKAILERYESMGRLIGQTTKTVSGTIRLSSIHGVGLHELPPYIKRFLKLYPQVHVRLEHMRDGQVYEEISKRRADLGIVAFPSPRPQIDVIPFRNDRMAIVCHPRHPLARGRQVRLSKIAGVNFVAFEKGLPTRKVIDQLLQENRVPVKITMEFNNIETLKSAIEIDAGISILPLVTVQNEISHKTLRTVEISGQTVIRPLGILVQRGRVLPLSVAKFVDVLLEKES